MFQKKILMLNSHYTGNDENFLINQTKQSYHTTKSGQSINHKKNNEFILSHA